jgi:hypothetical protein
MEAVFRPEISGLFPGDFWPDLTGKHWNQTEFAGKNPKAFRPEYCFQVPLISNAFLQEPAFFPGNSCRFRQNPVTGMFDLGSSSIGFQ